jgi:hypothetical protein
VHLAVREQNKDRGADVAALTASASAATAAWAAEAESAARIEAEAAAAWTESAETGLEAGGERSVPVGAVLTHVLAEIATSLPTVFVQGSALLGTEAEAEPTWWWCEWVVHW